MIPQATTGATSTERRPPRGIAIPWASTARRATTRSAIPGPTPKTSTATACSMRATAIYATAWILRPTRDLTPRPIPTPAPRWSCRAPHQTSIPNWAGPQIPPGASCAFRSRAARPPAPLKARQIRPLPGSLTLRAFGSNTAIPPPFNFTPSTPWAATGSKTRRRSRSAPAISRWPPSAPATAFTPRRRVLNATSIPPPACADRKHPSCSILSISTREKWFRHLETLSRAKTIPAMAP